MKNAVLEVKNLTVSFRTPEGKVQAVRDVSFRLEKGQTLAIVGESGSGKSVTSRAIMGLLAGNAVVEAGQILYEGQDLLKLSERQLCGLRGDAIAMVFQDPLSSLDPIVKIGKQLTETMRLRHKAACRRAKKEARALRRQLKTAKDSQRKACLQALQEANRLARRRFSPGEAKERALALLGEVGIDDPRRRFDQYPFELSGGQRQRIVIAMALSAEPEILICDEPTTALDVTVQAQILDLLGRLKQQRQLSMIFITHDLGVVANVADQVAVMYAGKIVEQGRSEEIFYDPRHPYTWALLGAMPDLHSRGTPAAIAGTPPDMTCPPVGDAFALRSEYAMQIDLEQQPPPFFVSDTHWAATWLLHPDAPKAEMPPALQAKIQRMREEQHGAG